MTANCIWVVMNINVNRAKMRCKVLTNDRIVIFFMISVDKNHYLISPSEGLNRTRPSPLPLTC